MKYVFPILYAILFVAAVPWYWPNDFEGTLLGFPTWVVVSLAFSFLISALATWQFIKFWPEFEEGEK